MYKEDVKRQTMQHISGAVLCLQLKVRIPL